MITIRIEQAELHPGVALIFEGRSEKVLAQVPFHTLTHLLGHRKAVYYAADCTKPGEVRIYDEIPEELVS